MRQVYIRPMGLIWGEDAAAAVAAHEAGRIAGGITAFTLAEIISREGARVRSEKRSFRDLAGSKESFVQDRMTRIEATREPVAGLAMTRPQIMGIVNVTPDSFSDGGECAAADQAIAHGAKLAAEGASIIDVGGESTRPGSEDVSDQEESRRVISVVSALAAAGHKVSIDTRKASIMREAAKAGAAMINDVSALQFDSESLATAAHLKLPVCLMHARGTPKTMQDNPEYENVVLDVFDELESFLEQADPAGVKRSLFLVDPGIGFGKTYEHNLEILRCLSIYHGLGVPVVLGASRKGFIGALTGEKAGADRAAGSLGAALAGVAQGVQMLRVHDVKATAQALKLWRATVEPTSSGL